MTVRPDDPSAELLESKVVHEAQERLEEEQDEDDDADDRVCVVHHAQVCCHVQTHGERGDVEYI